MEFKKITHLKWRELDQGVAYEIKEKIIIDDVMFLTLEGPGLISVWAPNRVRVALEDSEYTHIHSTGLKEKKAYYWDFEVATRKEMYS